MSLKETQKQGHRTLVAIAIIGVAVYLGFSPLFELVPSGVPQAVISSSFGAIFVIILTMYLLNKQTEVEQESKRGERIFDEKVKLYSEILETTKSMLEFDTTEKNIFITELPKENFSILDQVKNNNGFASVTDNVGIGINPNEDFIKEFEVNE